MSEKRIDLGLTALDELFMTEEGRQENRLPRIRQIPLDMIDDMPDHPFKVRRDDDMELLIESVREHGVITPIIVRQKEDGRYETAAGHRRRMASKINGLTTIPAEVREMTRDEAIIIMCESNLQRTKILPSEKAFSYRMRLEAMKRQAGRRSIENGVPLGHHFLFSVCLPVFSLLQAAFYTKRLFRSAEWKNAENCSRPYKLWLHHGINP